MVLFTIFAILIVAYVVLYLGGRKYLETFQDASTVTRPVSKSIPPPERPYSMQPIDHIDDYEEIGRAHV